MQLLLFFSFLFAFAAAVPIELDKRAVITLFPTLLVPLRQDQPNTPFGTQYTADISFSPGENNRVDTLVSFFNTVPQNQIRSCQLRFTLPVGQGVVAELTGVVRVSQGSSAQSQWWVGGSRTMEIVPLSGRDINPATDTWNNSPRYGNPVGTVYLPDPNGGDGQVNAVFPCRSGKNEFALRRQGNNAVIFHWFELASPVTGLTLIVNT